MGRKSDKKKTKRRQKEDNKKMREEKRSVVRDPGGGTKPLAIDSTLSNQRKFILSRIDISSFSRMEEKAER
jgi:hypothetical protein